MKKNLCIFLLLTFSLFSSQMTEVKSNRKEIGSIQSGMSKTKITLEKINDDYYVFSFIDNSYEQLKIPEAVILNEKPETMYAFYKSVFDDYENADVKEKIFKSGDYKITVNFLGKIPERHTAIFFQKVNSTKVVVTPFLSILEWFALLSDVDKK
ncbi:hypothetical protein JOE44_001989 [Chryseobacterium sp. PvR013]|uniref:hypothetical protein n=1 Tax=Chryseobacterium sp. PvR013 TaxID=2806595 RepID=UPI001AE95FB9|nr:hypothetical protein [Chryseobacterium sp. PvR013]MBP1165105.1 hypothetical protein [Chryseobacterium sp. PvR013]